MSALPEPGWFCFPCIYGNAYKNNNDYPASYTSNAQSYTVDGITYGALQRCVNHAGNGIQSECDPETEGNVGMRPDYFLR